MFLKTGEAMNTCLARLGKQHCLNSWSIKKLPQDLLVMPMVPSSIQLVVIKLKTLLSRMKMAIGITLIIKAI